MRANRWFVFAWAVPALAWAQSPSPETRNVAPDSATDAPADISADVTIHDGATRTAEPSPLTTNDDPMAASARSMLDRVTFDGRLRTVAFVTQNDPNVAFVGRDDGFAISAAEVGITVNASKRAIARLSLDGAVDERAHLNARTGTLRPRLRDAYLDIDAGALRVRAGRFTQLGTADPTASNKRLFTTLPLEVRGVADTQGWAARGLDPSPSIGVALHGNVSSSLAYEVALQNGNDEFAANNDNDWVSLAAALAVKTQRLDAVVSASVNPRTEGDLPAQQSEIDYNATAGLAADLGAVMIGAGGAVRVTQFSTTGGQQQLALGGHAQLGGRVWQQPNGASVLLAARVAIIDPSNLILSDRVFEPSLGATWIWPAANVRGHLGTTLAFEQTERTLANHRFVEAALEYAW